MQSPKDPVKEAKRQAAAAESARNIHNREMAGQDTGVTESDGLAGDIIDAKRRVARPQATGIGGLSGGVGTNV